MNTKIAIFDFDGTLFKGESMPFIWKIYGKLGYSRRKQIIALVKIMYIKMLSKSKFFKSITKETYKERATQYMLKLFNGFSKEEVDGFFTKANEYIVKELNPYVVQRLYDLKEDNYTVIVISAGYEIVLNKLKEALNIDYIIGTKLIYKENDMINTKVELEKIKGPKKVEKLWEVIDKNEIDYNNSFSFADSFADISILETVKNKEVINPDEKLLKVALIKGWKINY